jgi:dual specificity protein kinase YAK1
VILGYDHDFAIDIWSIGCVIAEIFIGLPLLCGQNSIQLLELQQQFLGPFPADLIARAPQRNVYFLADGSLKSEEQVCHELGKAVRERCPCFTETTLRGIVMKYAVGQGRTHADAQKVRGRRELLLHLLKRTLEVNPAERIVAEEALNHPFFHTDFAG